MKTFKIQITDQLGTQTEFECEGVDISDSGAIILFRNVANSPFADEIEVFLWIAAGCWTSAKRSD